MTPQQVDYWIVELRRRMTAAEVAITALQDDLDTLTLPYDRITGLTADRLLGRYTASTGVAQLIRIGAGLDLVGDTLVNTGGGGAITSFTLICVDDVTEHEVTIVLDQGEYTLDVNQAPGGASAIAGYTFTADDATDHVLRLRLDQGRYTIEIVQAPGGSGAIASLAMTCVTDSSARTLAVVLDQGWYTYEIT